MANAPRSPNENDSTQLSLPLPLQLGPVEPLRALEPGERFVLEGREIEGRLMSLYEGSAAVELFRENGKKERATWSLETSVHRIST